MKKRIIWLLLCVLLLFTGCSSKPDISGLWQTDFDEDVYYGFSSDLKFTLYEDYESGKPSNKILGGEYRLSEMNGVQCFGFGYYPDSSGTIIGMSGTLEVVNDDHFVLTKDERCEFGWQDWDTDVEALETNFMRVE